MRRSFALLIFGACVCPASLAAQTIPQPSYSNPRLQTVAWRPGEEIALTAMPQTGMRVVFELGEHVGQVTLSDPSAFSVQVSTDRDSLVIVPRSPQAQTTMTVATNRREFRFAVRTGTDLLAAYLVQIQSADTGARRGEAPNPEQYELTYGSERYEYKLRGNDALKPSDIFDDGSKTFLRFAPDQALPAVFAVGPTGGEEVVNGYMRKDVFVIDRIYDQLVLRIDKASLKAKRIGADVKSR